MDNVPEGPDGDEKPKGNDPSEDSTKRTIHVEASYNSPERPSNDGILLHELKSLQDSLCSNRERLKKLISTAAWYTTQREQVVLTIASNMKVQKHVKASIKAHKQEMIDMVKLMCQFCYAVTELYQSLPLKVRNYAADSLPPEISRETTNASSGHRATMMANMLMMAVWHFVRTVETKASNKQMSNIDQKIEVSALEAVVKAKTEMLETYDEEIRRTVKRMNELDTLLKRACRNMADLTSDRMKKSVNDSLENMTNECSSETSKEVDRENKSEPVTEGTWLDKRIEYISKLLRRIQEQSIGLKNEEQFTTNTLVCIHKDIESLKKLLRKEHEKARAFAEKHSLGIHLQIIDRDVDILRTLSIVLGDYREMQQAMENRQREVELHNENLKQEVNRSAERIAIVKYTIDEENERLKRLKERSNSQQASLLQGVGKTTEEWKQSEEINRKYLTNMVQQLNQFQEKFHAFCDLKTETNRKIRCHRKNVDEQEARLKDRLKALQKERKLLEESQKAVLKQFEQEEAEVRQRFGEISWQTSEAFQQFKDEELRRLQLQARQRAIGLTQYDDGIQRTWELVSVEHVNKHRKEKLRAIEENLRKKKDLIAEVKSRVTGKQDQCKRIDEELRQREKELKKLEETRLELEQEVSKKQAVLDTILNDVEKKAERRRQEECEIHEYESLSETLKWYKNDLQAKITRFRENNWQNKQQVIDRRDDVQRMIEKLQTLLIENQVLLNKASTLS